MLSKLNDTGQAKHFRQDSDKKDAQGVVAILTITSDCPWPGLSDRGGESHMSLDFLSFKAG